MAQRLNDAASRMGVIIKPLRVANVSHMAQMLNDAASERSPDSYQHVDPGLVGNRLRVLISELSGRQNILGLMRTLMDLDTTDGDGGGGSDITTTATATTDDKDMNERALVILDRVKRLESMGYTFEGADASVELMILHSTRGYCPPFQVLDYTAQVYDTDVDSASRVMSKMERRAKGGDLATLIQYLTKKDT